MPRIPGDPPWSYTLTKLHHNAIYAQRSTVHKFIPKLSTSRKWWTVHNDKVDAPAATRKGDQLWRWRHIHEPVVLVLPQSSWLGKVKTHKSRLRAPSILEEFDRHGCCRRCHHLYSTTNTSIIILNVQTTQASKCLHTPQGVRKSLDRQASTVIVLLPPHHCSLSYRPSTGSTSPTSGVHSISDDICLVDSKRGSERKRARSEEAYVGTGCL